jgi:hypothetical protein
VTQNILITPGNGGDVIAADAITYGGVTAKAQLIKLLDATEGSVNEAIVTDGGSLQTTSGPLSWSAGTTNPVVETGGIPVVAVSGPCAGGYITNPPDAVSQGIETAENLYADPVSSTPGNTLATANGTCSVIPTGETFKFGPLAAGQHIYVNCVSDGHMFTSVKQS